MMLGEDRTKSGQIPAVREYRKKLDSIQEHQLSDFDAVNERLERTAEECRSAPPEAGK